MNKIILSFIPFSKVIEFFPSKLNSDLYVTHQKKEIMITLIREKMKQLKEKNFRKNIKESSKLKEEILIIKGQGLKFNKKKWCVFLIIILQKNIRLI